MIARFLAGTGFAQEPASYPGRNPCRQWPNQV